MEQGGVRCQVAERHGQGAGWLERCAECRHRDQCTGHRGKGFTIPAGTEANVATRIKMGQTSNVHAVVKADNKFYVATKEVKVTLGGCGG